MTKYAMTKNNTASNIFILLVYLLFFLIANTTLRAAYAGMTSEELGLSDSRYYVMMNIMLVLSVFVNMPRCSSTPRVIGTIILWTLLQLSQLLLGGHESTFVLRLLSWPIIFISLYYYARLHHIGFSLKLFYWGLLLLSALSLSSEVQVRQQIVMGGMNEVYWVLLGFPFIIAMPTKKLRYGGIILMVAVVLLSLKSTAFLALLVAIFVAWMVEGGLKPKSLFIAIAIMVAIVIFWPMISDYLANNYNVIWTDKYNSSIESGGSGRTEIWTQAFTLLGGSSLLTLLFGHGHNAVFQNIGFSAHNDFLEVLFDYGIIAFILYISLYVQLIKLLKKMLKTNYWLKTPFTVSVVLFFIVSFFSHLMIYPGLLLHLAAFWGLCIGDFAKQQKIHHALYR